MTSKTSFLTENKGILLGFASSFVWIYFVVRYMTASGWWQQKYLLSSVEFIAQTGGFLMPVLLMILLGSFIDKVTQIKKRDEELRAYLNELVYPSSEMPQQTQDLLLSLKKELASFREILASLTEHSESIRTSVKNWVSKFSQISSVLSERSQATLNELEKRTSELSQAAEQAGEHMNQASGIFSEQAVILQRVTEQTTDQVGQIGEKLGTYLTETEKVSVQLEEKRKQQETALAKMQNLSTSFQTESEKLSTMAETYQKRVHDQNSRVFADLEKILSVFKAHGELLEEEVSNNLNKLRSFEETLMGNAGQVIHMGREGVLQLSQVGDLFNDRSHQFLGQLNQIRQEIQTISKEIEKNAALADQKLLKVLKKTPKRDMLKEAGVIVSRLQQGSVNLAHIFTPKIQEELWEKYYAGDKSIFMRHITRTISAKNIKQLKELYQENDTFKTQIDDYMSEFEKMTKMIQKDEEDNLLMGTILGSDMGRLYMILADLFKKE